MKRLRFSQESVSQSNDSWDVHMELPPKPKRCKQNADGLLMYFYVWKEIICLLPFLVIPFFFFFFPTFISPEIEKLLSKFNTNLLTDFYKHILFIKSCLKYFFSFNFLIRHCPGFSSLVTEDYAKKTFDNNWTYPCLCIPWTFSHSYTYFLNVLIGFPFQHTNTLSITTTTKADCNT